MATFTQIPESTFNEIQLDAGVLLKSFDPTTGALDKANIICATSGGIQASCTPTFSDYGEDVDNCPANMKELKKLDSWETKMSFTSLSVNAETIKLALGAADVSSNKITPRRDLKQDDFEDAIWWVGDRSDGGYAAVKLLNALGGGFSIQSTKNGKGTFSIELTGHVSIDAQDVVPMEFYVSAKGD